MKMIEFDLGRDETAVFFIDEASIPWAKELLKTYFTHVEVKSMRTAPDVPLEFLRPTVYFRHERDDIQTAIRNAWEKRCGNEIS